MWIFLKVSETTKCEKLSTFYRNSGFNDLSKDINSMLIRRLNEYITRNRYKTVITIFFVISVVRTLRWMGRELYTLQTVAFRESDVSV